MGALFSGERRRGGDLDLEGDLDTEREGRRRVGCGDRPRRLIWGARGMGGLRDRDRDRPR